MTSVKYLIVTLSLFGVACGSSPKPAANNGQVETTTTTAGVAYANCDAVKAAGKAPLHKGDPGYSSALDRDGDGTACDTKMTFAECQASAEYPGGRYAVEYDNGVCTVQKP